MEADIGGQRFAAVADVLCTGPAQAVRLTTSRRPPSPGELREDISWVLLYLLGQRAAGRDTVGVMMDLRGGRRLEYSLAADEVSRMEARLPAIAGSIRREREYRPQKGKHCRWCRSRSDCPAWKGP